MATKGETETTLKNLDAATIVLGFTGPLGSGCSYIANALEETGGTYKYKLYRISSVIRDHLKARGIAQPTVRELQNEGNDLRKRNGGEYLVRALIEKIDHEWPPDSSQGLIVDGIKNEAEVRFLRSFSRFCLFSVKADREHRRTRWVERQSNGTVAEFDEADLRDQEEQDVFGQQVKKCNYLADIIILNNEDIPPQSMTRKHQFIDNIRDRYIRLLEDSAHGRHSRDVSPSIDELCMTMAYALSKSSSCLKRKVGSVVVLSKDTKTSNNQTNEQASAMPVVVSSGYNEVPTGSHKCVFHPKYQKCYRDYLQEEYAKTLSHCPSCGESVSAQSHCPSCGRDFSQLLKCCSDCGEETVVSFICPKCDTSIADEFLPGGKDSPGKLLDMCRALHAEEMALLNLGRLTTGPKDRLTLYVTTQPCNLCSNKIVAAHIDTVVFDEPYSMKEGLDTLKAGGVNIQQFEGIKSSAFFRLYS